MILGENLVYLLVIILIALITIVSLLISYIRNGDLFSPVKIFIFFNTFFYLDIYINSYSYLVVATYFIQCLLLLIFVLVEKPIPVKSFYIKRELNKKVIISIWLLSIISIANQIAIVVELGGILNYIANIAFRVEYFKGRGYVLILNNLIAIMNVLYLSILLSSNSVNKKHWLLFICHFFTFVAIALLSGSRSFLLMTILVEIILFHYLFKRLTVVKLAPFMLLILFMVALLGGLRNSISTSDGEVSVSKGGLKMESTHFKYGLNPLDIVYKSPARELSYGMTYASLFTNFIPRKIYPDKLDTGGVVFTKRYTGDQWGGLSNLATGAVTEGVVNFGFVVGVIVGFLSLSLFYMFGVIIYSRLPWVLRTEENYAVVVLYIYIILAFARYSYSEFSYTFYTYILYYLIPVAVVIFLSKFRFFKSKLFKCN